VIDLAAFGFAAYLTAFVVVLVVRGHVRRAVLRADVAIDDDAAPTGAQFARALLDASGLGVVTVVAADVDAYRALHRELQLAAGRDARRSVAAWAIAAHEVGHAEQHKAGDQTWSRWWVLSGHGVWLAALIPVLLVAQLFIASPVPLLVALACGTVLAATAMLSWSVERAASTTARARLAAADLPDGAAASAQRVLRATAAGYVAESLLDTGFVDRLVDPWREPPLDQTGDG
jgi:Zn-dependent membrane protease YugP